MPSPTFYIENTTGRQVIRADQSPLKVNIIDLERENFVANDSEVTFYGSQPGRYMAFTATYDPDQLPVMTAALTWYADATGYPIDELSIKDPRTPQRQVALRLVR